MPENNSSEAAEVARLAIKGMAPLQLETDHKVDLIVFPDRTIRSLEQYGDMPKRPRARVSLMEAKSFIGYVNSHKMADMTALFGAATETGGNFSAILDYHNDKTGDAGWGEHTVSLSLVVTPEWKRWLENNDKSMTQEAFAEFIEDNMTDVVEPAAADLLEIAQLLTGTKGVTFKSGKSLKSGAIDFAYTEVIEAGGRRDDSMKVPDHFIIELCPFVGALGVKIKARLRFRISDSGKLTFRYLLDHPSKIVEEAFNASRALIESETGLPVHMGSAVVIPVPS